MIGESPVEYLEEPPVSDLGNPDSEGVEKAMKRALKLLAVRDRSCRELRDRLLKAGFDEETVGLAEERLVNVGLLDDASFAAQVVRHRAAGGKSSRFTRLDLLKRGVALEIVDASLAEAEQAGADEERALLLAERRAAACCNLPLEKAVPRVVRHLCSKGYEPTLAWEVARRVFRELETGID